MTIPESNVAGVYANFLTVWHTAHEFTLDFATTLPPEQRAHEDGSPEVVIPAWVTGRIRVPPTLVFDIIRALNENMTTYEANFGSIARPGDDQPIFPPDDLMGGDPE